MRDTFTVTGALIVALSVALMGHDAAERFGFMRPLACFWCVAVAAFVGVAWRCERALRGQ